MGEAFLEEILSQPRVLRAVLERYRRDDSLLRPLRRLTQEGCDLILLTGMGTSYFALYPACIYLHARSVPAVMVETSELLHYHRGVIADRVLVLVVSQSGQTVEARALLDAIGHEPLTVSLTNHPDSDVARRTHLSLFMHAGEERGPASKSYTVSLLVALLSAMAIAADLDDQSIRVLEDAADAVERFLTDWERRIDRLAEFVGQVDYLCLLGRGPSVASAAAGSLILKEVAKVRAEAMSSGQFRHGPLEIASPGFVACVFTPEGKTRELNLRLAYDIAGFGGKVVIIGGEGSEGREGVLHLPLAPLPELVAPVAEIVPLQLLARRMALDKGLEPGRFEQAGKITLEE